MSVAPGWYYTLRGSIRTNLMGFNWNNRILIAKNWCVALRWFRATVFTEAAAGAADTRGILMTHFAARAGRVALAGTVASTLILGLQQPGVAHAEPPPPEALVGACPAQRAVLDQVNAEILAHNAKPHVFTIPQQAAEAAAYDAEANALNSRGTAAQNSLIRCMDVVRKLFAGRNADKLNPTPRGLTQMIKRSHNASPNRQAEVEELVDFLDEQAQKYDDEWGRLQELDKPEVGATDPARPGQDVGSSTEGGPQVTPDWVVPLSDILKMPRALDLNADSLWMVATSPLNREWVSNQGAMARRSDSVAAVSGTSDEWLQAQLELAETIRGQLEGLIKELADSQLPAE
ncbi:MAG: hypothetical protein K0R68_3553 [Mycobacterium sp.]|nr:hypothetical protein [Mycobacterium sp.]